MAVYFVSRTGNGSAPTTDPGTSGTWTGAYATYGAAVTAATTAGDSILISDEHYEDLAADTTYTLGATDLKIIVVDHQNTAVASAMDYTNSWIGHKSSNRNIVHIATNKKIFMHGVCFSVTGTDTFAFRGDGGHYDIENAILRNGNSDMVFGGADLQMYACLKNTDIVINTSTTSMGINVAADLVIEGGSITYTASMPSSLFFVRVADPGGCTIELNGVDISEFSGNIVGDCTVAAARFKLVNCKLHASAVLFATQTNVNLSSAEVVLYNCSSGDVHWDFQHHNSLGSTVVETAIYASDGAEYNTTGTKYSWKIFTSADATFYNPYVSPWIHQYHEGTSAITPNLEGFRDGSTTIIQNDEVWAEFSYQGTTNLPLAVFANDRMVPLAAAADQTSSKTYSDWTASPATDAGDSVFKLATTANITPSEIGNLSARVCVGEPSITVYVDPQIRT
jgi:hypothetical protein